MKIKTNQQDNEIQGASPSEMISLMKPLVERVSKLVSDLAGIQLGPEKSSMVESRLNIRMMRLGISTSKEYSYYLETHLNDETQALLSLLTTHHTFFFREFGQFEFLINGGLERICQMAKSQGRRKIQVWSAACSRGHEGYSLAMFLHVHLKEIAPDMDFEIFGTDVDAESISYAKNGVYPYKDIKGIPQIYAAGSFQRGTGNISDFVKVKEHLKAHCHFATGNLLDLKSKTKTLANHH